ncbi:MAG: phosphoribosyl-AMP cyclohydrolase [bacterium]
MMLFGSSKTLKFNDHGLLPAVIQDYNGKKVLMFVQMTREAVRRTRKTGELWLYHRQKKKTWKKGSKSGKTMKVVDMFLHHDRNILLVQVFSKGAACHTGHESCFYHSYLKEPDIAPRDASVGKGEDGLADLRKLFEKEHLADQVEIVENFEDNHVGDDPKAPFEEIPKEGKSGLPDQDVNESEPIKGMFERIRADLRGEASDSYYSIMADSGPEKIAQKIGEDAMQLVVSAVHDNHEKIVDKGAQIIGHILLLLAERKIDVETLAGKLQKDLRNSP